MLAVALGLLLLFAQLPVEGIASRWPALLEALQNTAHVPVFAALFLLVHRYLEWRWRSASARNMAFALAFSIGAGGLIEYLQGLLGRDSAWVDLGNDCVGAAMAALYVAARDARMRNLPVRRATCLAGMALMAAIAMAPLAFTCGAYVTRWLETPTIWTKIVWP